MGQANLGAFYANGLGGLPKDMREAAQLYKLSADQGNSLGQTNLGVFYENGRGGLYAQLGTDYGYSHGDIARVVGKSRSHVANTLRLANLPEHTRALLAGGQISAGHARALLAVAEPDALADRIVAEGMTVRDIERFGENSGKTTRPRKATATVDADTLALQDKLALALGAKVTIHSGREGGDIRIAFRDLNQLDEFCRRLCQSAH